ncbi:MAG TPA: hypothetical protein VES79_04590 [Solirubrobacteraceae bacterium]|nr:hypothetical protein [Solirubrobacteraceae bacterium]
MQSSRRTQLVAATTVAALCVGTLVSACGGGGNGSSAPAKVSQDRFDPDNFGDRVTATNKYIPLKPGTQTVREGRVNIGHRRLAHRVVTTVTDVFKEVDGVRTVSVLDQDFNGGEIAEQSLDFLAEDKQGNVWYHGSYTEAYEGGQFVNAADGWLTGLKGARPGILMKADPRTGTPAYSPARPPGGEADAAQVVKTGQRECVPFKCYKGVLVIQEGSESQPDEEYKYYAPGVGQIMAEPRGEGGKQEIEKLINLTQLSPRALSEISAEALKLDRHARVEVADVFGRTPAAKRTP